MRIFKRETGKTFTEYLTEYRIEMALQMLNTNNYKIYEVSKCVGYSNPKYFCKILLFEVLFAMFLSFAISKRLLSEFIVLKNKMHAFVVLL